MVSKEGREREGKELRKERMGVRERGRKRVRRGRGTMRKSSFPSGVCAVSI